MKRPWLAITRTAIISGLLLSPMMGWGDTAPTVRAPLKNPTADTWRSLPAPTHSLADFDPSSDSEYCFDRAKEPYTAVVDAHFHAKPFGGPAMDPQELWSAFDRLGVRSARRVAILARASMTPVRTSAAERTNIAPIVSGAGFPNTA